MPLICRAHGDNEAFVAIHRAMCQRRSIDIEYRAKRGPRSWRFSPHALVDTGSRPHFRGFAADPVSGNGHYIDLLPARVAAVATARQSYISSNSDKEWTRRVDLTFKITDGLDEALIDTITMEYDLSRGEFTIPSTREALARYVIRYFLERRVEGRDQPIFRYVGDYDPLR